MEKFTCISVSFKRCGENIRRTFAFDENRRKEFVRKISGFSPVILCTCNRTEAYLYGGGSLSAGEKLLYELAGVDPRGMTAITLRYSGEQAVRHLFSVACGIDSMILGEDEILRQTKAAYYFSKNLIPLIPETNMIFQAAFSSAKKVKTGTMLSKTSISTAALAAKEAARSGENVNVLLIGASGEIGSKILKNLLSYKNVTVFAAARSHNSRIALKAKDPALKIIDFSERYRYISQCGCVISATSSPHFTITAEKFSEAVSDGKNRLFIDLAVPADIDPEIKNIKGASLIGIDQFELLAKDNNIRKLESAEQVHTILSAGTDELRKRLSLRRFLAESGGAGNLPDLSSDKVIYKLKTSMSAQAFGELLCALKEL